MAGPRINRRGGAGRELCAKTPDGAGTGRQIFAPPRPIANTKPANPQRTQKQTTTQPQQQSGPSTNPTPTQPEEAGTWAKVARKGHEDKEKITGPPKKTERTIVVHRNSEEVNTEADIHHMRDTINNILRHNKAPTNLHISGIQWNKRGNLTLTTLNRFTEEELVPHITTIKAQIEKFDKDISAVGKQETWTKVIVHKVDLGMFEDSEEGMQSLKTELETFNKGLELASIPRYLTHPDKRQKKIHSSCVIAMKDKTQIKRLLQYGIAIFGRQHKTEEYFPARPSNQCKLCQQFGHHYR